MFSLPHTLKTFTAFVQDEAAVISVDFVVLTASAAGLGMATMAAFSAEVGFVTANVADGTQQHRDSRPSYAYRAHDPETYQAYAVAVSQLTDEDLAVLAAWGNATRNSPEQLTNPGAIQFFEDFDHAITLAYANRNQSRSDETEFEDYDLGRVSSMLGFSTS